MKIDHYYQLEGTFEGRSNKVMCEIILRGSKVINISMQIIVTTFCASITKLMDIWINNS